MAFVPFVESDQPTMAAFNEKFQEAISTAMAADPTISVGSYTGNGQSSQTIQVGFSPSLVILIGDMLNSGDKGIGVGMPGATYFAPQGGLSSFSIGFGPTYFTVSAGGTYDFPPGNSSGKIYRYVALG